MISPTPVLTPTVRVTSPEPQRRPFPYRLAAAGLIALWTVLNLAYLACDCPLDLAPDEAHYWDWSRRLDWGYYSKGPLVAWLIRASCELFGGLSHSLTGSQVLAVRLPAVLSSAALLAGLYVLTSGSLRSQRVALAVVAVAVTLPPIAVAAVVMTIDPPFLACWCWALVGVQRAVTAGGRSGIGWWVLAGVCSAIGVLAKYPMLLLPAAVAGFLLVHRRHELRRPGFWLFISLTTLGCLPILAWNAAHDWVSFRHVLGQAGVGDGVNRPAFRWFGPAEFAAGQFGLLLGFWFVAFAAAGWKYRRSSDPALSLLWWASVPVWGVFFVASFRTAGQVNWPAAAYVGGSVLAVAWVREQLVHPAAWRRRHVLRAMAVTAVLGIAMSVVLHYPALVRPAVAWLAGSPTPTNPTPIRKLDPTGRLRGWQTLAAEVDQVRDRIERETGRPPVLAGTAWMIPGELAFYCRGRPEVYSVGLALTDRHSQYDLWRPNPVADPEAFRGRSFVMVGDAVPNAEAFERLDPPFPIVHVEDGVPVAMWVVWIGHGFKQFDGPRPRLDQPGY